MMTWTLIAFLFFSNVTEPLTLSLAAFEYHTTAVWDEDTDADEELQLVTQNLFAEVLTQLFDESGYDWVNVFSYEKLAPRIFEFGVSVHFKDKDTIPDLDDVETKIAVLLRAGKQFNDRYIELLKNMQSTIFATSFAVNYINNQDTLDAKVAAATATLPSEESSDDENVVSSYLKDVEEIHLLAALGVVAIMLACCLFCCWRRRRRIKTLPVLDFDFYGGKDIEYDAQSQHDSQPIQRFAAQAQDNNSYFQSAGLSNFATGESEDISIDDSQTMSTRSGQQVFRTDQANDFLTRQSDPDPFSNDQETVNTGMNSVKARLQTLEAIIDENEEGEEESAMGTTLTSARTEGNRTLGSEHSSILADRGKPSPTLSVKERLAQYEAHRTSIVDDALSEDIDDESEAESDFSEGPHKSVSAAGKHQSNVHLVSDPWGVCDSQASTPPLAKSVSVDTNQMSQLSAPSVDGSRVSHEAKARVQAMRSAQHGADSEKEDVEMNYLSSPSSSNQSSESREEPPWMALRRKTVSPPPPPEKAQASKEKVNSTVPEWMQKFQEMGLKKSDS